jgi:hypothetical protein
MAFLHKTVPLLSNLITKKLLVVEDEVDVKVPFPKFIVPVKIPAK